MIRFFNDHEIVGLVVAILVAVLSGWKLLIINQREAVLQSRLDSYRGSATQPLELPWYRRLGSLVATSSLIGTVEQQRLLKLLALGGIKGGASLANFLAIKFCCAIACSFLSWPFMGLMPGSIYRIAVLGAGLILGWRIPDIILNRLINRRKARLDQGLPDAMDLLVVCSEAGLSLNQGIDQVSKELRLSNRDVADEFATTVAEMQVGADFGKALDNLVERTGLDELRSLVATLKQSIKYGTPLAESLRMISNEMRAARHARIEERAARLPVILSIPMALFILPCVMMIVGTPLVVQLMDMFRNMSFGGGF